jgi:chromosome segregation ATPase
VEALAEAQRRTEERVGRLEAAVEALAEAQRRTEERVEALAEAQRHIEERLARLEATVQELVEVQRRHEERLARLEATVQELVEVQRRHEERLARLEAIVEALVEAQRRTEERLTRLEDAVQELVKVVQKHEERLETIEQILAKALIRMDRLESQVGQLANRLGLDLEVDAEEVLRSLLEDRGIRMLQEPFALEVDGEMDVVVPVELPTGERPWIIVEVKGRLRRKELGEFLQRLQRPSIQEELQRAGVQKPYLPYAFGLRVYADVDRMAEEAGVGVLSFRGERVAPRLWE